MSSSGDDIGIGDIKDGEGIAAGAGSSSTVVHNESPSQTFMGLGELLSTLRQSDKEEDRLLVATFERLIAHYQGENVELKAERNAARADLKIAYEERNAALKIESECQRQLAKINERLRGMTISIIVLSIASLALLALGGYQIYQIIGA